MPFAREWSEELTAEWLEVRGYALSTGIKIKRKELDIVAFKITDDKPDLWHIEVGAQYNRLDIFRDAVKSKTSPEIRNVLCKMFNVSESCYHYSYFAIVNPKTKHAAFEKFLGENPEIVLDREWIGRIIADVYKKYTNKKKVPPNNLWLLKFVNTLLGNGFLKDIDDVNIYCIEDDVDA